MNTSQSSESCLDTTLEASSDSGFESCHMTKDSPKKQTFKLSEETNLSLCNSIYTYIASEYSNIDSLLCRKLSFGNITSIEWSNKNIKSVPDDIVFPSSLRKVNLSSNILDAIPFGILSLPKLEYLDVSCNRITTISDNLQSYKTLQYLDLSSNQLKLPPPWINKLVNVINLNLCNNPVENTFEKFKCCGLNATGKMLRVVELNNCKLIGFPSFVTTAKDLRTLRISNDVNNFNRGFFSTRSSTSVHYANSVIDIPPEISQLNMLTVLHMSNLGILELPEDFSKLQNLRELVLDGNRFEQIPDVVLRLCHLTVIDLSVNKLSFLPKSINSMANIKELYFSYNDITNLPEDLHTLNHITTLDTYRNKIILEDMIQLHMLDKLEELDVSKNNVSLEDFQTVHDMQKYEKMQKKLRSKLPYGHLRENLVEKYEEIKVEEGSELEDEYNDTNQIHPPIFEDETASLVSNCSGEIWFSGDALDVRFQSVQEPHELNTVLATRTFKETGFALSGLKTDLSDCNGKGRNSSDWEYDTISNLSEYDFDRPQTTQHKTFSISDFDRLKKFVDLGPSTLIPSDNHAKNLTSSQWKMKRATHDLLKGQFDNAEEPKLILNDQFCSRNVRKGLSNLSTVNAFSQTIT